MMILARLAVNAVIIAGLFSFVPGVGTTTTANLIALAATLALVNSLLPWALPLAGIPFNLGSFIIALVITDSVLIWLGVVSLGIIFVTSAGSIVLVIAVTAILSWFVQSLGFDYYQNGKRAKSLTITPPRKNILK